MGTTPVLDLDLLHPVRQSVRITSSLHADGRLYEMRNRNELSIDELKAIESLGQQAEKLIDDNMGKTMTSEHLRLMNDWLRQLLDTALHTKLEDEVFGEMSIDHKLAILDAFTKASSQQRNRQARRATKKQRR